VLLDLLAILLLIYIEPLLLVIHTHMAESVDSLLNDFLKVFLELAVVALHLLQSLFINVLEVFTQFVDDQSRSQLQESVQIVDFVAHHT